MTMSARATVDQANAQAKLNQTLAGATDADVPLRPSPPPTAQANLDSAQAKLDNPRFDPPDIDSARRADQRPGGATASSTKLALQSADPS